jgi:hypothetical protein
MDKLKLSSLIAISYVMIAMTCLNVTRWCQLIRKTIKLLIGSWLSAWLISQPQAYALSLSHDRAVPANLIQYIVPRFSLKTRIRFDRVETAGDLRLVIQQSEHGVAIFSLASGETVYLEPNGSALSDPDYLGFVDWLLSDPGRAAIADFRQDGAQVAFPMAAIEEAPVQVTIVGDPGHGQELSVSHCRRCHKVDRADKYSGIGNAPSFHAMRSCDDWFLRFSTFYTVSPHKALISVKGSGIEQDRGLITIAPIDLQMSDINDIVAFVHTLTPLDLGQPLQFNP